MSLLDDPELPQRLAPAPRPLTPRARRRSWNEMPVRIWVILTLAVVIVAGFVTGERVMQARKDRWLILNGVVIQAKVMKGNGSIVPKRWLRSEPIPAVVEFTLPGGQPMQMEIIVPSKQDSHLQVGGTYEIKIDPQDPQRWTEQTVPQPWSTELVVPAMLLPVVLLLIVTTLLKRQSMLKVWSEGTVSEAVVVEARHTAMAPGSRIIRYSVATEGDSRIFSLLLPTSAGIPEPGQHFWLIAYPQSPGRAIAAGLYIDPVSAAATT